MKTSRKFIAISSIIAGVILFLLGITSIGFYIYSVVETQGNADRSVIFWYLFFVFMGLMLVAAGIYFIWIGYKSRIEENYAGLAKYSLGGLGTVLVVLILAGTFSEWSADKIRSKTMKQEEVRKSLAADMHHIDQIEINKFDQTGFSFSVHLSEGLEGSYQLKTTIGNKQAVFLEKIEEVRLDNSKSGATYHVSFHQFFQKCFDEFQGLNIYVCIENTGAKSFFTLESQLVLIKDEEQRITKTNEEVKLKSLGKTQFSMNTFVKNQQVKVNDFQPINR